MLVRRRAAAPIATAAVSLARARFRAAIRSMSVPYAVARRQYENEMKRLRESRVDDWLTIVG
jgi:hypothetical protein